MKCHFSHERRARSMKRSSLFLCMIIIFILVPLSASAANYIVTGATMADANGLYVENGISDGVARYTKGNWILGRENPMGAAWVIRNGPRTYDDIIYINWTFPAGDLPPNDGNWSEWQGGSVLGLTITLSSQSIPTTTEWGMALLTLLLAASAIWMMRRNRTA